MISLLLALVAYPHCALAQQRPKKRKMDLLEEIAAKKASTEKCEQMNGLLSLSLSLNQILCVLQGDSAALPAESVAVHGGRHHRPRWRRSV